jgi:hypothetical protein
MPLTGMVFGNAAEDAMGGKMHGTVYSDDGNESTPVAIEDRCSACFREEFGNGDVQCVQE